MTIGMFDSGVGGLGVLGEVRALLPQADIVYLADRGFAPYGDRSLSEVRERSVAIVEHLVASSCSLVVIACNSASAASLRHLRATFPEVTFVGMEPAVKPAAATTRAGVIGVLATRATFQGELYASVVDRHTTGVRVVAQPAPDLVELVEAARFDEAIPLLRHHLEPMIAAGIDRLVLGCTHFPALLEQIRAVLPDGVDIIDPAPAVARQVARQMARRSGPMGSGTTIHLATDPSPIGTVSARPVAAAPVGAG